MTYTEVIQILALHQHKRYTKKLRQNQLVAQAMDNIRHFPLAVAIVAGLCLKTDQEWQQTIDATCINDPKAKLSQYKFNLFAVITMCIDQLDQKKRHLFRQLGVFKHVEIPIRSIICLWQMNEQEAVDLLKELDSRSLLQYHDNSQRYQS